MKKKRGCETSHGILDGGLYGDHIILGKCSIQEKINLDMEQYEKQIDELIIYLSGELLK